MLWCSSVSRVIISELDFMCCLILPIAALFHSEIRFVPPLIVVAASSLRLVFLRVLYHVLVLAIVALVVKVGGWLSLTGLGIFFFFGSSNRSTKAHDDHSDSHAEDGNEA